MRWIRGPKIDVRTRMPRRIKGVDLVSIWKAAEAITSKRRREKWRAVFALLYATGMRRSQLAALDVGDLDLVGGQIRVDAETIEGNWKQDSKHQEVFDEIFYEINKYKKSKQETGYSELRPSATR